MVGTQEDEDDDNGAVDEEIVAPLATLLHACGARAVWLVGYADGAPLKPRREEEKKEENRLQRESSSSSSDDGSGGD